MKAEFVRTKYLVPPGGTWFFDGYGEHVEDPIYDVAVRKVADLLRRNNDLTDPATALAAFMCPIMPRWFCRGDAAPKLTIYAKDARDEAMNYFHRSLVPMDETTRRLEKCMACPMHRRDFCLTCGEHDRYVYDGFGGRRVKLPGDAASGCCLCAKTFEAVVASVAYGPDEPVWEGAPDTCWRNAR